MLQNNYFIPKKERNSKLRKYKRRVQMFSVLGKINN